MARLLRAYLSTALENVALWHERDISHSSVERVTLPDATILMHYMLVQCTKLIERLEVDRKRMRAHLDTGGGVVFSQRVLLALVEAGVSRERAYRIVQKHALAAWNRGHSFREQLEHDRTVKTKLNRKQLAACFDLQPYLKHAELILKRSVPRPRRSSR
jgi:adenylosuccinate lyase